MEKDIKVGDVWQGGGEVTVGVFVEKRVVCVGVGVIGIA